jgi:hypothetical protein
VKSLENESRTVSLASIDQQLERKQHPEQEGQSKQAEPYRKKSSALSNLRFIKNHFGKSSSIAILSRKRIYEPIQAGRIKSFVGIEVFMCNGVVFSG